MGPVGSRLCKTMTAQRPGTTALNQFDLGDLSDLDKRLQYLKDYYYYGELRSSLNSQT